MPEIRREIARCIREQRAARRYAREHGWTASVWLWLTDWLMEEAILRCQN